MIKIVEAHIFLQRIFYFESIEKKAGLIIIIVQLFQFILLISSVRLSQIYENFFSRPGESIVIQNIYFFWKSEHKLTNCIAHFTARNMLVLFSVIRSPRVESREISDYGKLFPRFQLQV